MKPGIFELRIAIAGLRLICNQCAAPLYFSDASQPSAWDGKRILEIAARHDCPNLGKAAA